MTRPANLEVVPEPHYSIHVETPNGHAYWLTIYARNEWKRVSAVCHARTFAQRQPTYRVRVVLALHRPYLKVS